MAAPAPTKMTGWNVLLQVNGVTVDSCDREHAITEADQITLSGFAELKLKKDDVVRLVVSSRGKSYDVFAGDAVLQAQLLRWW